MPEGIFRPNMPSVGPPTSCPAVAVCLDAYTTHALGTTDGRTIAATLAIRPSQGGNVVIFSIANDDLARATLRGTDGAARMTRHPKSSHLDLQNTSRSMTTTFYVYAYHNAISGNYFLST